MPINRKELKAGIEVEREHSDLVRALKTRRGLTEEEVYTMIAKAHLREIPDYYSRLTHMEHTYFRGK